MTLTPVASLTVWGFTATDDEYAIMTRDTSVQGIIGAIRLHNRQTGARNRLRDIPNVITGLNQVATAFRAPKSLVYLDGNFYVRVVRAVTGNMRFIKFDSDLVVQDDDLVVNTSSPTALGDATTNGYRNIFILQHNEHKLYAVRASNFETVAALETELDSRNTIPRAIAAHGENLYVADRGGYIYKYTGVPTKPDTVASTGSSSGFGIFQMVLQNELLGREFNPRRRRYP